MNTVSIESLTDKLQNLSLKSRQEVYTFIEFLKSKEQKDLRRRKDKKKLLTVSTWRDKDIILIENAQKELNKWEIKKF